MSAAGDAFLSVNRCMLQGCLFGLAVECATARPSTRTGLISWTELGMNPVQGAKLGQAVRIRLCPH